MVLVPNIAMSIFDDLPADEMFDTTHVTNVKQKIINQDLQHDLLRSQFEVT